MSNSGGLNQDQMRTIAINILQLKRLLEKNSTHRAPTRVRLPSSWTKHPETGSPLTVAI